MSNQITHRERIINALEHKESDRVPVDLGGTSNTTINVKAYLKLRKYLGLPEVEPIFMAALGYLVRNVEVDEDVLRTLDIDTRGFVPKIPMSFLKIDSGQDPSYIFATDWWERVWRMPKVGGEYFDIFRYPLSGPKTEQELSSFQMMPQDNPLFFEGLREKATEFRKNGYPIILGRNTGGGIFEGAWTLRGMEDFFCDLALDQRKAEILMDKFMDDKMRFYEKCFAEIPGMIDIVMEADDLGSQSGTLISPDTYRKYIKPRHKKLFDFIKKKSGTKTFIILHSCGAVKEFIPDFIDCGVDALNPVQVNACGMGTKILKREFGREIAFWGGIDSSFVMPRGSVDEVKGEVRKRIDDLAKGGGFVCASVHNIQSDVPPENIVALFESACQF